MPRRKGDTKFPATSTLLPPARIAIELDNTVVGAISLVQRLYHEHEPISFEAMESFVDCHNHLKKALDIARKELGQFRLPEPPNPDQPKLPVQEVIDYD